MQKFVLYIQILTPCRENVQVSKLAVKWIVLLRVMGLNLTNEMSYRMTHGCSGILKWEAKYWVKISLVSYSFINYI